MLEHTPRHVTQYGQLIRASTAVDSPFFFVPCLFIVVATVSTVLWVRMPREISTLSALKHAMGLMGPGESASDEITFVSLGMLVLDELRFPSRPTLHDVVGGSGACSQSQSFCWPFRSLTRHQGTLGARLFNPYPQSRLTGCIVMAGNDFPDSVTLGLQRWSMSLWKHVDLQNPSTRGLARL